MTIPPVVAPDPFANLTTPARWLYERAKPDDAAMELVNTKLSLEEQYNAWVKAGEFGTCIRMIAGVLPSRESVWWSWVSTRHATQMPGGKPATREVHATLAAIERWIVRPDDETRRAAWDSGNVAGLDTPVGMVSAAVFLSGTSVAPANIPPVPPPPGAAMPIVAGAILVAGSVNEVAENIAPTLAAFAAQGLEIVKRLGGWDAALAHAHETQLRLEQEHARVTSA